ncbi:numb-like protein isoform X2 [Bolinopsis microptera]|uniref:numb-like protein isoform X2 n=1 Tax=Bolinopsis microptera TaxID=2820187 RepID=UPI00307A6ABA
MKKIKKNIGQQKNGVSQQHFEADKDLVAKSGASFCVKYLGYEEVKEARGVKVCSVAVAKLIKDKKNKKKMSLSISMDGVRVVDDISRVLVLDQPIEKISFCAPDSLNPKLFSYIARDGPCRRWLCYGFYATDVPGERLSHALGCAFTACLQRKQKAGKVKESNNSTGSSKGSSIENSPSTLPAKGTPTKHPPMMKANTTANITTIKRLPPKEITVPIPDFSRDRSATTIGISTPPTQSAILQRAQTNPFGDEFNPENNFTADLADILLFDPSEDKVGTQQEQRRRAATQLPGTDSLDEFDPLHPTFKSMQFEDNFKPPTVEPSHLANNPGYHGNNSGYHGNNSFAHTNPFSSAVMSEGSSQQQFDDFDIFASNRLTLR